MAEILYPCFTRGRILKIGMLENLRDFPRAVLDCSYEGFSDGIISGLTPLVDKNNITFSKGVIKHKGEYFLVQDLTAIQYGATDKEVSIKIVFKENNQTPDYKIQNIDFLIDPDVSVKDDEIELGRFKLKSGAYLRSDYQDLGDFTTEYNTINIVNVLYAGYNRPTLSHLILKYFAEAALASNSQNPLDVAFTLLCLNSTRIERDVILNYIWNRLGTESFPDKLTNNEIHAKLSHALEIVKKDGVPRKRVNPLIKKVKLD